jgi:hypothetical protein
MPGLIPYGAGAAPTRMSAVRVIPVTVTQVTGSSMPGSQPVTLAARDVGEVTSRPATRIHIARGHPRGRRGRPAQHPLHQRS